MPTGTSSSRFTNKSTTSSTRTVPGRHLSTRGSVWDLIPDFIDAGFDTLNPVQCSAAKMDPIELKKEFGRDVVFWGGGVDTQKTMAFGTPDEVYNEVRQRVEIFNDGGGFVFNAIHNIQGNVSIENVLAMFRAIKDSSYS